jgi:large subunit ribosomal protein L4e
MAKRKLEEPTPPVDGETPAEEPEMKPAAKKEEAPAEARRPSRAKKAPKEEPKRAEKKPKPPRAPLPEHQVHVYSLQGEVVKTIELPSVFRSPVRTDLIRRAVRAFQANRRQPYGPSRKAGMRHSVRWSGKGHGVSRAPRIRGTMIGAQAPGTVGGRKGHGPKPWADWSMKINHKEAIKARNAALAALSVTDTVSRRGHRFEADRTLPIVVENDLEALWEELADKKGEERVKATKRGAEVLKALGVYGDIERATAGTHIRAGRGKLRGRAYRTPTSVLVVATKLDGVSRMFRNFPGVDVVAPSGLNAEVLAPGGDPGRLAIFTEDALEILRGWAP